MRRLIHHNIGPIDQWLRASGGYVLLMLAGTGVIGAWGYLGVLPMASAMLGYCPVYQMLGIHTGARRGQGT